MSVASFIFSLIRHGPNIMLYPGAFEPHPRHVDLPSRLGLDYEDITLTTSDQVNIKAYLITHSAPELDIKCSLDFSSNLISIQNEYDRRPTVLMFHGNSDNIGYTLPLAKKFKKFGCNILMLSPRGYGLSEGRPSTKGFRRDANAALDFILRHPILRKGPIILYGQSMGAAFATDLASRRADKITALILENTFLSLRKLIPDVMPVFSPLAPFFRQWNSEKNITKLPSSISLLMLSGQSDEVIPPSHMKGLWKTANPKVAHPGLERYGKFVEFADGYHNDTWDQPGYWESIAEFIENLPSDSCAK